MYDLTNIPDITNEETQELNALIESGGIEVTDDQLVWGVQGFKTKDGKVEVAVKYGKFYGGGISDKYFTFIKDGVEVITLKNEALKMRKLFYDAIQNN